MRTQPEVSVLLVDDSPAIRLRVRQLLQESREAAVHVVAEAGDGAKGLVEIAANRPDIIVLDLKMPGVGGLEVLQRLAPPKPIVLVLTNYATAQYRRQALALGADYFLDKSTEFGQLPGIVAAVATRCGQAPPWQRRRGRDGR